SVARVGSDRWRRDNCGGDISDQGGLRQTCTAGAGWTGWSSDEIVSDSCEFSNGGNHPRRRHIRSDGIHSLSMDFANDASEIEMKRKWNWPIWLGFIVAVGGLLSYEFFARFPITRDFP